MRLSKFVFTEAPPQFLRETKRFASVKDSGLLKVFGTMRLTGDHQKIFENFSPEF